MEDAILYSACIGGGLVFCGYILGLNRGHKIGVRNAMTELIRANLVNPDDIMRHYDGQTKKRHGGDGA